jgi:4a-hydroxytetrahydrobiopterin dehydratase
MADKPLTPQELDERLASLSHWKRDGDALVRDFEFGSFREAMSFMVRVAFEAEALNHHPEWTNVYDRVSIRLTTHHAGNKVTGKDLQLAEAIERIDWTS